MTEGQSNSSKLLIMIVIAAIAAVIYGALFPQQALHTGFLGEVFLNALKMMVLPLIVTSLVVGVTHLKDIKQLGNLGTRTFVYYMITTGIAVVVGIVLVELLQPGKNFGAFVGDLPQHIRDKENFSFLDVIIGLIHPNLFQAAADFKVLPIIVATIFFAIALTSLGEKGNVVVEVFSVLNAVIMKIVNVIILFTPIGVFGLIAHRLAKAGGGEAFFDLILQLGKYCGTVIAGLLIHALIVLPIILLIFAKRNPIEYMRNLAQALMTAFATASSSSTLPVTLKCTQKNAGVSQKSSSFVLPLGATVNMDGTALYEAVAAIFIAQAYGIDLGIGQLVVIFLTATLAAIGAAGIPEAGLVTMVIVLQSVGLPIDGIGLILAVDWFLDRCRTTINVWGDSVGAAVVDRMDKDED